MTKVNEAALRYTEWSLLTNALVEIRHHGATIRTGVVDAVMPDSSMVWIAADAAHPRQLFEASEGHEIWVALQEHKGPLTYRMTARQVFGPHARPKPDKELTVSRAAQQLPKVKLTEARGAHSRGQFS